MVATSVNNTRVYEALTQVKALVAEHGSDEQRAKLDRIMGGAVPAPRNRPIESQTFLAEGLLIAFEMIAELKEANRPKKRRGRKPNVEYKAS